MAFRIGILVFLVAPCSFVLGGPPQAILGGDIASIGSYPYLVSIRKNGYHLCGGAIITDQIILTAAHCIQGHIGPPFNNIRVFSGSDKLNEGGIPHELKQAYYHSGFIRSTAKNDLGFLVLKRRMIFISHVQEAIELPESDFKDYAPGVIPGFGRWAANSLSLSPHLKKLDTQILHPDYCTRFHGIKIVTPGQICGYQRRGRGHGTCQGDSGGPLVSGKRIVGIVSHGTSLGVDGVECGVTPDIHTDVYFYLDVIRNVIKSHENEAWENTLYPSPEMTRPFYHPFYPMNYRIMY